MGYKFSNVLMAVNNGYVIPLVASIAALVLVAVLIAVTVCGMRRKKNNSENRVNAENVDVADGDKAVNKQCSETATPSEVAVTPSEVAETQGEQTVTEENADTLNGTAVNGGNVQNTASTAIKERKSTGTAAKGKVKAKPDENVRYIIIKYNKSFTAKLIQSEDEVKNYYSVLKNELLSYKGIKSRVSWKGETFYCGRQTYAKLSVRGKCICLFLAIVAKNYADTKYKVDDMSEISAYEKTPCLYRVKNERRLKYSAELIKAAMNGREKAEGYEITDYAKQYPYEKIEPLIERKLVKVLTEEDAKSGDVFKPRNMVSASEVDELMQDETAVALIEETDEISDRTKTDIVNIDTLSRYFSDGETVTLDEIKKRIPSISKRTTYIKVLARGKLDKKLVVIADSFSIEAAKMILLTGGSAIKKKN